MNQPQLITALGRVSAEAIRAAAEWAKVANTPDSRSDYERAKQDFLTEVRSFMEQLGVEYGELLQIAELDNRLIRFTQLPCSNPPLEITAIVRLLAEAFQNAEQHMATSGGLFTTSNDAQATFCRLVQFSSDVQRHPEDREAIRCLAAEAQSLMTQLARINPLAEFCFGDIHEHLSSLQGGCSDDQRHAAIHVVEIFANLMVGEPISVE
jgi:hypothetical protein